MRYAIVSDIHANLEAWNIVLADLADMRVDKIICLGDVTGYGPKPVEVLESVYRVVQDTLMGNHDAAVCGILNPDTFSPRAKAAVLLHRQLISQAGMDWLKSLPLTFETPGFRCAHGDFSNPAGFHYIIDPEEALPSWRATTEQLLFVGHSHLAGIYVIGESGAPHFVGPCDFELENGKRYIVNPGSVGYPRTGECRSTYCVFDDQARTIIFRQLPFDTEGYRKALKEAGLGDDPWLQQDESRQHVPWLRDRLPFAKEAASGDHAQDLHERARLNLRDNHKRRSPLITLLTLATCAALAAGALVVRARRDAAQSTLAVTIPDFDLSSVNAYPLNPPDRNLLPVLPATLSSGARIEGWRYAFDDRAKQSFSAALRDGALLLSIRNVGSYRIRLESPLINLAGTQLQALRLRGRIRKPEAFSGTVFYQLVTYTTEQDGTLALGSTHSFEVRDSKRKTQTLTGTLNRKVDLGKTVSHVRFRIDAAFNGTLEIEQPQLAGEPNKPTAPKESAE